MEHEIRQGATSLLGHLRDRPVDAEHGRAAAAALAQALGHRDVSELRRTITADLFEMRYRVQYDSVFAAMDGEAWLRFMNHGYLPEPGEIRRLDRLDPQDALWTHQIALYFRLVEAFLEHENRESLDGLTILDVGCGRGGGLDSIAKYYGPQTALGVDLNARQIDFCRATATQSQVEFRQGSSTALPIADGSVDLVINVESSHAYSDVGMFLADCRRVLKPGGMLLLADNRWSGPGVQLLELDLLVSGFALVAHADITERVMHACRLDAERFTQAHFGSPKAEFVRRKAVESGRNYRSGHHKYLYYLLRN